jgi:hypothetical protein
MTLSPTHSGSRSMTISPTHWKLLAATRRRLADILVSTSLELQASATPAQTRLVDNHLVDLGREGALKVMSEYVNTGRSSRDK